MKRTVDKEQYYTSASLVDRCVDELSSLFPLHEFNLVMEPSAGDGAFLSRLSGVNHVALDIDPRHPSVQKTDFFSWTPPKFASSKPFILTLGNPPFGQRGCLAMRFVKHACEFSNVVAFILPRIFKKHTFQSRIPRQFHLVREFDCDEFRLPNGKMTKIKCVFQVWEKRDTMRDIPHLDSTHPDFDMKHYHMSRLPVPFAEIHDRYDFSIAQVGSKFLPRDHRTLKAGSHWFIKAKQPYVKEVFMKLDFSFLKDMNTAFMSLSKKDIILAYKKALLNVHHNDVMVMSQHVTNT
jgi:hypothetical protein